MAKIGKRFVDGVDPTALSKRAVYMDDDLPGFGLRVTPAGQKTYVCVSRRGSRIVWYTIGRHGAPWTAESARRKAGEILLKIKNGEDVQHEKRQLRARKTVAELIELYLREGPVDKPNKRATSWEQDRSSLDRHVRPLIGARLADDLTRADIAKLQTDIAEGKSAASIKTRSRGLARVRGGKSTASRTIIILQAMFEWALRRGLVSTNPARGVERFTVEKRERYLSPDEFSKLFQALDDLQSEGAIHAAHATAIRLLALTGARKREIEGLRWSEVNVAQRAIILPAERSKTGAKRIPLSRRSLEELAALPRRSEFVFPSLRGAAGHTTSVPDAWERIRERAELTGVRLHDLRHSFASLAAESGASLLLIGRALGHSQARTTERYAHIGADPVMQISETVAARIGRAARTPVAD